MKLYLHCHNANAAFPFHHLHNSVSVILTERVLPSCRPFRRGVQKPSFGYRDTSRRIATTRLITSRYAHHFFILTYIQHETRAGQISDACATGRSIRYISPLSHRASSEVITSLHFGTCVRNPPSNCSIALHRAAPSPSPSLPQPSSSWPKLLTLFELFWEQDLRDGRPNATGEVALRG